MSAVATSTAVDDDHSDHSDHDDRIARALARLHAAVAQRPGFGHSTATAVTTLVDGLRCSTREHSSLIESDLGRALGGEATAPSPSALLRAALGACLAMGYRLRAAELGVVLDAVRVTVESESDVRGMLDPESDVPAGLTAVRYHVEIESPASERDIERVVDLGDRLSPVLEMLTQPQTLARTVSIGKVV